MHQSPDNDNEFHKPNKTSYHVSFPQIGKWGDSLVMVHSTLDLFENVNKRETLVILSTLLELSHENIIQFLGVILEPSRQSMVTQVANRGTLYHVLGDVAITMAQDIKMSLLYDIASGMRYLHQSALEQHGYLTSQCCLLDSKWVCKIANYWYGSEGGKLSTKTRYLLSSDPENLLWTAPEVLQQKQLSKEADVFSYGVIMQEVLTRERPYGLNTPLLDAGDIITRLSDPETSSYRPHLSKEMCSEAWYQLAQQSWSSTPSMRPSFREIITQLNEINGGKRLSLLDEIAIRLERHTIHLEERVAEKSLSITEEKARAENLVCELLPRSVYLQLKQGKSVEPETFDLVSLFFSDIVGFTALAASATPMQIVTLLNDLYSRFDGVIGQHDVYKVATIGDAYIVVSGMPERNGDRHAGEVAAMALQLQDAVQHIKIRHNPSKKLLMRVGLHSGPCVGAITGSKMPRYLLFGDTVSVGTRIEASGEASRIHVSSNTAAILCQDSRFVMTERDDAVDVIGFGNMQTWWLDGMNNHV